MAKRVEPLHCSHVKYSAAVVQIYNEGSCPLRRTGHAMASDMTRVFVLGGFSPSARSDKISLIHVFGTSIYFPLVISSGRPPILRTQSTSSTRIPSLLSLMM